MNAMLPEPKKVVANRGDSVPLPIPMNELIEYRAAIERLAERRSPELFNNGKPEHAAIIFETFLKFAKKRVAIFCEKLSAQVFGSPGFLMALEAAALKGVKVDIIVQGEPEAKNLVAAIDAWRERLNNITLLRAKGPVSDLPSNFATMDGEAYRFEPNRNVTTAHASMFNPRLAAQLEDTFFKFKAALV
jgi:phosphatidylserine/phosphatidylglycerophosphate/cardiolipin synthase-like enzyme